VERGHVQQVLNPVHGLPQPWRRAKSAGVRQQYLQGQPSRWAASMTNDGRWIVKAAATTNSRRQSGASVGAGYQW